MNLIAEEVFLVSNLFLSYNTPKRIGGIGKFCQVAAGVEFVMNGYLF